MKLPALGTALGATGAAAPGPLPPAIERGRLGFAALVLAYALKKEYWKDVH